MFAVLLVCLLFFFASAILIGEPMEMQNFMVATATECKANSIPCTQCKLRAEFIYNDENRESPDFVPLWNMVRWKTKFSHICSAVMGSGL